MEGMEIAVIVDVFHKIKVASSHSVIVSTQSPARAAWRMEEASNCLAWCVHGSQATVITP